MHGNSKIAVFLTAAVLLISFGCARLDSFGQNPAPVPVKSAQHKLQGGRAMSFALKSTAFANGSEIPVRYTCSGANLSPALSWDGVPAGTHSLALIADDPDAPMGTWTHWLIWNIPAQTAALPEGVPLAEVLGNGARQGKNSSRRIGYEGPCPPPGKPHRYFFKLYALDAVLDVKAGADRSELEPDLNRHVLSETEWMGTFKR
jgi:Raf kinase inhibitor-like YbhB/YbcL family protein